MKDAYRYLAWIYTPLSKLVFGKKLQEAKTCFLTDFSGKKMLILGGGDGFDYKPMQKQLQGDFWEISTSMLERAKRNLPTSSLNFHLGKFESEESYNLILLPFVLDTLRDDDLEALLFKLNGNLKKGGRIFLSDFFGPKHFHQKIMQKLMIGFFRLLTSHPRKDLPDYKSYLNPLGFSLIEEKIWSDGWIRAQLWEKT
ncbi:class I SAM-dependent methyltransferase [Algoriphagus sp. CAU 1675]|uniref:class I SAM-dependent methyltransferase n=1 Tax=Algoriphagus sp. CAU 1675 TaxID=3032597 RepID=UPI0023D9A515|nr:class I SAM-dependent methyltransferase [Algoriphagus sp. CAU 1675]MDF2158793.1 class I SAM-dependent methyltransferase [Algoriphagus sp. CAU 1675]